METKVQPRMGNTGFIIFLALLSAFVPLSTDLYLPALPTMTRFFNVSEIIMNLTLILFFIFYSVATIIWGPLSDKFGRRPILLIGLILYTVASVLCGLAGSAFQIISFRVLQAIGGGVATTVATAVIKDVYRGRKQETTLAIVQSMVVISPALAPVLGSLLLTFISWRGIFYTQALLGMTVVFGSLIFKETHTDLETTTSLLGVFGRLAVLMKNPAFSAMLVNFSAVSIISLSYISSSSYIFQVHFGLSSQMFSYFFAFNALGMLLGPLVYIRLSKFIDRMVILYASFILCVVGGLLIIAFGLNNPYWFALMELPATLASSASRPPATYLILKQQENDNGSASSLYSAGGTIMGSVGMVIVSLANQWPVLIIAWIDIIIGVLCTVGLYVTLSRLKAKIIL